MSMLERLRRFKKEHAAPKQEETSVSATYLIVGLGNPGREHRLDRHNAGWMVLDVLAVRYNATFGKKQSKALLADFRMGSNKIILAKPQTYMNNSGEAVQPLAKFYNVPLENVLIIYDDLDIPVGAMRFRAKGSHGGQNGMRSIIQRLGTNEFPRLRIGIDRPPGRMPAAAYVLRPFDKQQQSIMEQVFIESADAVEHFVKNDIEQTMSRFNKTIT